MFEGSSVINTVNHFTAMTGVQRRSADEDDADGVSVWMLTMPETNQYICLLIDQEVLDVETAVVAFGG